MTHDQEGDAQEIPLPNIKAEKALAAALALVESFQGYVGETLTDERLEWLARDFAALNYEVRALVGIRRTLRQLVGQRLTAISAERLAWQLVGRTHELMGGNPVALFDKPTANGWALVEIIDAVPSEWPGGKRAVDMRLWALTGGPAGFTFVKKVPEGWFRYLVYQLAYTRRIEYPDTPALLRGVRFWAHLVTVGAGELEMVTWKTDSKVHERNKALVAVRHRDELGYDGGCPIGLAIPCLECTKLPHECPYSVQERKAPIGGTLRRPRADP